MKTKPITPYQRLLMQFRDYANKVSYPHKTTMFVYPKKRLSEGWNLQEVWDRAMAANQLGYETHIQAGDDGLRIVYVKARPSRPYNV